MNKIVDFYIKSAKHKDFNNDIIENTSLAEIIVSKIQMILFTNKGEVMHDPNYGCDIPRLLWQTNITSEEIEEEITDQILQYIPEVKQYGYSCTFYILPGTVQDIGVIEINLNFTTVSAVFN